MDFSAGWIALTGYAMVQNLVFVLIFVFQRTIPHPHKWILAALSFCCGMILFEDFIGMTIGYASLPHLTFATGPVWYLIPPMLFLFLRVQLSRQPLLLTDLLHLIPFLIVIYNSAEFYMFSGSAKLAYLDAYVSGTFAAQEHRWNYILFFVQAVLYTGAAIRLYTRHAHGAAALRGQLFFLIGLMAIACLGLFALIASHSGSGSLIRLNSDLFLLWLAAFVLFIFVRSVRSQRRSFSFKGPAKQLDPDDAHQIARQVMAYVRTNKAFLDPACTVHDVAHGLGLSKNRVEQAIRHSLQCNFRELLNTLRVAEAKLRLCQPESRHYTIQSIAESVGFRSQATFYRAFKKVEGMTPRQFLAKSQ